MPKQRLTDEEITFIIDSYPKNGLRFCAETIGGCERSIRTIVEKFKLKVCGEVYKKIITDAYLRSNADVLKKEYDSFFDFSKPESVYLLGFLWADGCVRDGRISIGIQIEDGEKLKNVFLSAIPFRMLVFDKKRYEVETKKILSFRKGNLLIYNRLLSLDYHQKSKLSPTRVLSEIPENMHHLFWRGFFDGDGSVYHNYEKAMNSICLAGSFDQDWSDLLLFLEKNKIFARVVKVEKDKSKSSSVVFSKYNEVKMFLDLMYPNGWDGIGLKRKFDKMIEQKRKTRGTVFKLTNLGLYFVYKHKDSYVAAFKYKNKDYRKQSKDIRVCADFIDETILSLGIEGAKFNRELLIS